MVIAIVPFVVTQSGSAASTVQPQTTAATANTTGCTREEQTAFFSTLPNAAACASSLETVGTPPLNNPHVLTVAFENQCTQDCGGAYVEFQDSVCEDELAAESIRLMCTPSNGSAAVGDYCRFALADILDPLLLSSLDHCANSSEQLPCPSGCREALNRVKHEMGCCYQNVYNNSLCVNNSLLLSAGTITKDEFETLKALNDPSGNPWIRCRVNPPKRCGPPIFKPPKAPKCTSTDDSRFVAFLPEPVVCGLGLDTVFNPPANDSEKLATALEDVCSNDCGGIYANYRKTVCDDELASESLRVFCTLTDGSAAIRMHCRYAVGDVFDTKAFDSLISCYNITSKTHCPSDCRNGLLKLKAQLGCCYQNVYNNTLYLTELLKRGLLSSSSFIGLENLNNPAINPWTLCEVEPPQGCSRPPFTLPPTPIMGQCDLYDQRAYLLTLANGAPCGNAIGIAFGLPHNNLNSTTLQASIDYLCTSECGNIYTNYLEGACKDKLGAESMKVYCTPTSGTAAVGSYCYFAANHALHPSLLTTLMPCDSYSDEIPCSDECKNALLNVKSRIGCCYQTLYNNTAYNTLLFESRFITQEDLDAYQSLNDADGNPWTRCNIEPPQKCPPVPFKPLAAPKCTLTDQITFASTLPNAAVCGPSIATVFSYPQNVSTALSLALKNTCTKDCGGVYANYLENVCDMTLAAESLRIYCTPTNGTAAIGGDYCRYAVLDILGSSTFDDIHAACHNLSTLAPCSEKCKSALLNLKTQVGCCYQNIYNNTDYYTELMYAGFITPHEFTEFFNANIPAVNGWTLCDIEPPQMCAPPPFKPPVTPNCTQTDINKFLYTLPQGNECELSLKTVIHLNTGNPKALATAFDHACTNDCGGAYAEYLENVCNDPLSGENVRLYCTSANGSATVGQYCRQASFDVLDASLFRALATCNYSSVEEQCTAECREGLLDLKAAIGCCYQNVYNNTPYFVQLLNAGIITPAFFTQFVLFNNPISNPWKACMVEAPGRCLGEPFHPGEYIDYCLSCSY